MPEEEESPTQGIQLNRAQDLVYGTQSGAGKIPQQGSERQEIVPKPCSVSKPYSLNSKLC